MAVGSINTRAVNYDELVADLDLQNRWMLVAKLGRRVSGEGHRPKQSFKRVASVGFVHELDEQCQFFTAVK